MKKLFITVAFIAVSISTCFSQNNAGRNQSVNLTVETGGFIGIADPFKASGFTPVNLVGSYRFNEYYSLGVGAGLNIYSKYDQTTLPVFARFRANILKSTITPFAQLDAGTNINLSSPDNPSVHLKGFVEGLFVTPAVGVSYRLKNDKALNLSVGFRVQNGDFEKWSPKGGGTGTISDGNMAFSLTIMLGFTF